MKQTVVIALGGNAILPHKSSGKLEEQKAAVERTTKQIALLIREGWRVILTHGNGPQVGNILIQQEEAKKIIPPMPLDVCGAESQGQIGYLIQQSLKNELDKLNLDSNVVTIITQVLVSQNDSAFSHPTKPIGPFYSKEYAEKMRKKGLVVVEDAGRGYRRVVPSPRPLHIIEADEIKELVKRGSIVIACGGGGIPVVERNGELEGVEAVIDKDLAAELLAKEVEADLLAIVTDVEKVAINFRKPNQINLDLLKVSEAKEYFEKGEFPPGSMGPKVKAAINFVESTGKTTLITSTEKLADGINGRAGTRIIRD